MSLLAPANFLCSAFMQCLPIEVVVLPAAVFALFHFPESWILANLWFGRAGRGLWNAACYVDTISELRSFSEAAAASYSRESSHE
jgi:hypothetical protein